MQQDFRHFLPVSSDVLYRSPSHRAGNAAQALDSGEVPLDAKLYQPVPFLAGSSANDGFVTIVRKFDAHHVDLQDQPGETLIRDENV